MKWQIDFVFMNKSRVTSSSPINGVGLGRARRRLAAHVPPQEIIQFKFRQPALARQGRGFSQETHSST